VTAPDDCECPQAALCRLKQWQELAEFGGWELDLGDHSLFWSDEIYRLFEIDKQSFGASYEAFLGAIHPDDRDLVDCTYRASVASRQPYFITHRLQMPDGRIKWVEERGRTFYDDAGRPLRSIGTVREITDRMGAERKLAETAASLALVFDHTSDHLLLIEVSPTGERRIRAINATFRKTLQEIWPACREADAIGRDPDELMEELGIHPTESFPELANVECVVRTGGILRFRSDIVALSTTLDVLLIPVIDAAGVCTHVLWTARDVTEARRATDRVAAQLAEKEVLLREIHHRVKNNLQIVSSLLYLQEQISASSALAAMLTESRSRIAAMSLVHETLYSSGNLASIDIEAYARSLAGSLEASFGVVQRGIALSIEGESFFLEIDRAIPCGLILNELVTNALKHAFPGGRRGTISIGLAITSSNFEVHVRDDGVGMPMSSNDSRGGLGLLLVPRLTAQLGATIERESCEGTLLVLRIPKRSTRRP